MWSRTARLAHRRAKRALSDKAHRVGLISLGCPKNLVDSEIMLGRLQERGYTVVDNAADAETVLVNTCGFVEEAQQESIESILEIAALKAEGGVARLLVAGCMVNRFGDELAAAVPEIDGFVGLDDLDRVGDVVSIGGGPPSQGPAFKVFDHTAPRVVTTPGYAYLKVAEGCNNPCTFCAIPIWRGQLRSRTLGSLVTEAQQLEAGGAREICLVAQDTTRYGEDLGLGKDGLVKLVEVLLEQTTLPWIRFLYAYPTTLNPDLLRLMGEERRFVSYLDMPLQHSHPDMLVAMKRGGRARHYLEQIELARELVPDIFLRSTFIVGFPGETREHFDHLLGFVREARFDHLGGFVYSPEDQTPAAELPNRVPGPTAQRRYDELLEAQRPVALASREGLVGRRIEVLVEGACDETEHLLQGRHRGMAPGIDGRVLINDGTAPAGSLVEVEITEAYADDIVGRIVGSGIEHGVQLAVS